MDQIKTEIASITDVNAGDLFKDLVWSAVIKAATAALLRAIPFLAGWPWSMIAGVVVELVGGFVYDQLKDVYNFESTAIVNEAHRREYDSASIKLKLIARDKGIQSDEFKQAREKYADALAKFVKFGGA